MLATIRPTSDDVKVPFPRSQRTLKPEGEELEVSGYWRRRIRDGSVVIVNPEPTKPTRRRVTRDAPNEESAT